MNTRQNVPGNGAKPNNFGANFGFEEKLWKTPGKMPKNMDAAEYKRCFRFDIFEVYFRCF